MTYDVIAVNTAESPLRMIGPETAVQVFPASQLSIVWSDGGIDTIPAVDSAGHPIAAIVPSLSNATVFDRTADTYLAYTVEGSGVLYVDTETNVAALESTYGVICTVDTQGIPALEDPKASAQAVQAGVVTVTIPTLSTSGTAAVTFPIPFSATPIVVVSSDNEDCIASAHDATASGFTAELSTPFVDAGIAGSSDNPVGVGAVTNDVSWIATGQAPVPGLPCGVFNGSDDYVSLGTPSDLGFEYNTPWSLGGWIKTTQGTAAVLFSKEQNSGAFIGYALAINGTEIFVQLLGTGGTSDDLSTYVSPTGVNDGDDHHVLVTYDGSRTPGGLVLYMDELPLTASTYANTLSTSLANASPACFGAINAAPDYAGKMWEWGAWSVALDSTDVATVRAGTPAAVPSGLVGHWPFDEGEDATVHDTSGNGNHGTWHGTGAHWATR